MAEGSEEPSVRTAAAPTDRCWSLPVVAACLALFFSIPNTNCGILYVLFMEKFGISREAAMWPKTIQLVTASIMGFAIGGLQRKVSIYSMMVIGALICPAAVLTSAFVPNMEWMSVTFGFFYGASMGILSITTSIYIVSYFHKYRNVAIGIMSVGYSLSAIAGAPLLPYLFQAYGTDGAMLVTGGIMLNLIPLVVLLRNSDSSGIWLWQVSTAMKDPDKPATATTYGTAQKSSKNIRSASIREFTCQPSDTLGKSDYKNKETEPVLQSNNSVHMLPPAADLLPPLPTSEQHGSIEGIVRQTLVLLQTPCFHVILISMLACDFTFQIFNSTIVDYARDKGLSLNKGAQLAACSSAGCICGQVLIPFLFDKLTGSRCTPAALSFGVLSACFIIMPCLVDFVATSVLTFVTGIQQGYIRNMKPVLTADYLGTHLVAVSWAVMGLITLPLTFFEPAIVGVFRDSGGSYDNLYRTCAATDIAATLVLLLQSGVDYRNRRMDKRSLTPEYDRL